MIKLTVPWCPGKKLLGLRPALHFASRSKERRIGAVEFGECAGIVAYVGVRERTTCNLNSLAGSTLSLETLGGIVCARRKYAQEEPRK